VNGEVIAPSAYSPTGWRPDNFQRTTPGFCAIGMGIYFVSYARPRGAERWGEQLFWRGNEIADAPLWPCAFNIGEQIAFILERDPEAWFIVRNGGWTCPSWCDLHPDEMFAGLDGQPTEHPSLGSRLWFDNVSRHGAALIRWCERQPWADRVIGHWYGWEHEGTPVNTFDHQLCDYSPAMQRRFAEFMKDPAARVPDDRLLRPGGAELPYLQGPKENQALREYLTCLAECFHQGFEQVYSTLRSASRGTPLILTDCLKTTMQGWSNYGFFKPDYDRPERFNETMAASGHMHVAALLDTGLVDGVITPHDYQNRGVGGVFEPEGCVDSVVLRDKLFLVEADVRTWVDDREQGRYGTAKDLRSFEAINWRNFAAAHTRGCTAYWMDLVGAWYNDPGVLASIRRVAEVQREAVDWEHRTVPGIAMIIDDQAALETCGAGEVVAESVSFQWRQVLPYCGVPFRIHLLEDLEHLDFPQHPVLYFPNHYRGDVQLPPGTCVVGGAYVNLPPAPTSPAGWRELARRASAHIYCETDDVVLADSGLVAIHSNESGLKRILLPGTRRITDVVSGEVFAESADTIEVELNAPGTRVFRLENCDE